MTVTDLMKAHVIALVGASCMLSGCNHKSDDSAQALGDYQERAKRTIAQQDAYDQRAKRAEAMLARQEQILKKQEDDNARFERILDTWESQQQQYQKYLDSLPK
jgi:uncharacterized membrane protein YccC